MDVRAAKLAFGVFQNGKWLYYYCRSARAFLG